MHRIIRWFTVLSLFAICGCGPGATNVAVIDATIPNTEVYYRSTLLGRTPLQVTQSMCEKHGFKIPKNELIVDGWGEGIAFGTEDEHESKIMFLVPEPHRGRYLSIETPWGVRTKRSGSSGNYNGPPVKLSTDFMPLVDDDGIRLMLHQIPTARPSAVVDLRLTLTGTGSKVITGFRPELEARWGAYDTPWRKRSSSELKLDSDYCTISPGDEFEFSMPIQVPDVTGDYSLFVVFHLFDKEAGRTLEIGAVYSESRNLRVRQ